MIKSTKTISNKTHVYTDYVLLGHNLAGLWEGDGNINVKDKSYPKPTFHITLHIQQVPCIQKLMLILRRLCNNDPVGSISIRPDNNSCVLNVYTPAGLNCVFSLIHDKLKTPKAYQLNLISSWLNQKHGTKLKAVSQDPIFTMNTPWFAGFTDADGCFSIDLRYQTRKSVACQFQINQRLKDPKSGLCYDELFNSIAYALNVKLCTIMEKKSGRYYYVIKASSLKSKDILRYYFDTYPLLTSKNLDYHDWCKVDDHMRNKNTEKVIKLDSISEIKKV
uniref:Putative LAGLIDADG homing endonuclease n=1 Tax=Gloeotilopsis planctonica TaxID=34157 RepID=A0A1B2RYZ8_9CHLO|nr:putative LAGLIDADG homing endonuclease [Gloeotilopsis planctonica]